MIPMLTGLATDGLKRRLGLILTMTVGLTLWLWFAARIDTQHALRPSAALDYWLAKIQLGHAPRQVADVSQWIRAHKTLMGLVAFGGGVIANGSALRTSLLREGRAALIAWPCLILAAESLGLHAAVTTALWGFLLFPLVATILALIPSALLNSPNRFSLGTVMDGLMLNFVQFMGVFLVPTVVFWLLDPYSSGLGPRPADDKVADFNAPRAAARPQPTVPREAIGDADFV